MILLGGIGSCDDAQFGGTQYAATIVKSLWGMPPALDMDLEKRVQAAIRKVVAEGLAESSHDIGEGGLAVALAECSFGGIGASIEIDSALRPEYLLFHEGPSRILVTSAEPDRVHAIAAEFSVEALEIGVTVEGRLNIVGLLDSAIADLKSTHDRGLETLLHV